jgi:hypothetical protein
VVGDVGGFRWCLLGGDDHLYLPGFLVSRADSGAIVGDVTVPAGRYDPLMRTVASLAGPAAEQRYTGCTWRELASTVAGTDLTMAMDALARLGDAAGLGHGARVRSRPCHA